MPVVASEASAAGPEVVSIGWGEAGGKGWSELGAALRGLVVSLVVVVVVGSIWIDVP